MYPRAVIKLPYDLSLIIERLRQAGYEAYPVGGVVRDYLLRRTTTDWDIATSASAEALKGLFEDKRTFTLKDRTFSVVSGKTNYEITPYKGSPPCLATDLSLRDFTIDAIAYDPDRMLILDPQGGYSDLKKRLVRCVGDPKDRFREDPLRLLRAVRIASQLRFKIEKKTLGAVTECAEMIKEAAIERIRDEIIKLVLVERPSDAVRLLIKTRLLEVILPELMEGFRKRQPFPHRHTILTHALLTMDQVPADLVLRLAALFHDIAKPRTLSYDGERRRFLGHEKKGSEMTSLIMERMRFNHEIIERVTRLVANHMVVYDASWSDAAVRRLLLRMGEKNAKELTLLMQADIIAQGAGAERIKSVEELRERLCIIGRQFEISGKRLLAVDGRDVMASLGIGPGPLVGKMLRELTEAVIENPALNTKATLLRLLEYRKTSI